MNHRSPTGGPTAIGREARSDGLLEFAARPRLAWLVIALIALLWFGGLELRGLFIPDEARYAEIPREMLANGDWITPRLNDLKYFEKPPLQYWMTAIVFRLFGEDEWTARLWSALAGFSGLIVVLLTTARLASWRAGLLASAVLASSWGYFLGGQYLTLDMSLTFFLTCALCSFLLAQRTDLAPSDRRRWMLAAWAAMALAVLTKGMIGIVLPGLALAVHMLLARDFRLLGRLHLLPGLALFLAIVAPWFVLVGARNPEFFHFFFIQEHLQRFAATGHNRPGPWWFFLPILLAATLPWTPLVLTTLFRQRRGVAPTVPSRVGTNRFLLIWCATVLVFFSLSHSKLPAYVLPVVPALAMLAGQRFAHAEAPATRSAAVTLAIAGAVLLGGLYFWPMPARPGEEAEAIATARPWLYGAGALLSLGGGAAWLRHRRRVGVAIALVVLSSLAGWQVVFEFLHDIDGVYSAERLVEDFIKEERPFRPAVPFYSVRMFDHSVPFYLGRPVRLVAEMNELGPGIAAEPAKFVATMNEFEREWRQNPAAFAIMPPAVYAELAGQGLPMRQLSRDTRRVIVARF